MQETPIIGIVPLETTNITKTPVRWLGDRGRETPFHCKHNQAYVKSYPNGQTWLKLKAGRF